MAFVPVDVESNILDGAKSGVIYINFYTHGGL
jgi:hypothetical protein